MERAWLHQRRQKPIEYRQALLELTGASTRFPRRQFAREISSPVRLIEAERLLSATHFPNLVEQLRQPGPDLTRRIIRGGHYLQLDAEHAVLAELRDFAAQMDARAAGAPVSER
jgi:hypothetical protein